MGFLVFHSTPIRANSIFKIRGIQSVSALSPRLSKPYFAYFARSIMISLLRLMNSAIASGFSGAFASAARS